VEFDPQAHLDRELSRAIAIVEQAVPVPHPERYSVVMAPLPDGVLGRYEEGENRILLNEEVTWAVWEQTAGLEQRIVYDPASVIAHEIACHDPQIPLQHHPDGWLTNPNYEMVRRINKFDRPGHNGAQLVATREGACALVRVYGARVE